MSGAGFFLNWAGKVKSSEGALDEGRDIRLVSCATQKVSEREREMVGVRFSRIAEQKSGELATSMVKKLMESPRTTAYRAMQVESLQEDYRAFFLNLTEWLLYRSGADIEERFTELGSVRARQGVPLEQCVFAQLACRDHLVSYLRHEATQQSIHGKGVELFGELEFVVALSHFFDDAIFFCMKGYQNLQLAAERVA